MHSPSKRWADYQALLAGTEHLAAQETDCAREAILYDGHARIWCPKRQAVVTYRSVEALDADRRVPRR